MKNKTLLLALVICFGIKLNAQFSVSYNFSAEAPRLVHGIIAEHTWHHHRAGAGVTFNQGFSNGYPYSSNWYLKPTELKDYMGVMASYNYVFYPTDSEIEPYAFGNIEYTKCGRKGLGFTNQSDMISDPYSTLMPIIGLGFTTQAYKNFFFNMMAGAGLMHEDIYHNGIDLTSAGATYKIGASIGYAFNKE